MGKLEGKVAFVTGAARGQGRSHAIHLAREGAAVIAVDVCGQVDTVKYPMSTPADLAETVRLVERAGGQIHAGRGDVRDADELREVLDQGVREFGGLDIVIANAGICTVESVLALTPDVWRAVVDVNLTGVFNTVHVSLPHLMAAAPGASIVIISSVSSLRAVPTLSHYGASKSGVDGFAQTLALELAPHSIRVNTIHPTHVDTGMIQNEAVRRLFLPDEENPTREQSEPVYQATNAMPVPWLDPDDIARAALYLVSDDARYVTGTKLAVDAGYSLL